MLDHEKIQNAVREEVVIKQFKRWCPEIRHEKIQNFTDVAYLIMSGVARVSDTQAATLRRLGQTTLIAASKSNRLTPSPHG